MRAAPADDEALDRGLAARTRLARALEDREREPLRRRAAASPDAPLAGDALSRPDGLLEDGDDRPVEASEALSVERLDPLERMDLRLVEDLVRVDVADPGHERGVEEDRLHGPAPLPAPLVEHRERELRLERLGADRRLEVAAHLVVDHVEPAEPARVLEVEALRAQVEREARPPARFLRAREDPELPRELQVEDERAPLAEVYEDELPAPRDVADRALERSRDGPAASARVPDGDAQDPRSEDALAEVADYVLDFGELGHGLCRSCVLGLRSVGFRSVRGMGSLFQEEPEKPALKGIAAMAASGELVSAPRDVECFELPCRSILNKCSSPRMPFDFTINPYRGCELGCTYCYARYTHEFLELTPSRDFERKIYAKRGAARALARELVRYDRRKAIAIGTATDPYQPLERRLELTRSILDELSRHEGLRLHVTTKSDLVVRDLDLLREIARKNAFDINVTLTTLDAALARSLEPRAPTPQKRLEAIRALRAAGIEVHVLLCPVLPWINDSNEALEAVCRAARDAGALGVYTQVLFLPDATRPTFFEWLKGAFPALVPRYRALYERSNYVSDAFAAPIRARVAAARLAAGFGPDDDEDDEDDEDEDDDQDERPPPASQLALFE